MDEEILDKEPFDAGDPVTSSSESENEYELRGPHRGKIFQKRKDLPKTPNRQSQRQLQLQSPPPSHRKEGPIATLAPGQILSKKATKMPQKRAAAKAPRKAPAGKTAKKPAKKTAKKTARTRRTKPGIAALRQIKKYQKSVDPLIPRAPFVRLLKEIMVDLKVDFRLQASAVSALQEAAETTLVKEFEMTQLAAIHAKRVTIQQKDMKLVQAMRLHMTGFAFPGNKE